MQEFFTREAGNNGYKLELTRPDGEPTDHWIEIYSVDSDEYHKSNARLRRQLGTVEIEAKAIEDLKDREEYLIDKQREMECELLSSLSFEQDPTADNKREFVRNAPQIANQINQLSGRRALFTKTDAES